ncbi:MAG TPA: SPOR domain-containing protein [Chitinophagaceae bacterium]
MKILFTSVTLLITAICFSQDTVWKKNMDTNAVVVHKDPRLDMLVKKQAQINEETSRDARRIVKGFRLMIISTNKLDEAIAAKTKVYTYFPELKAYMWHQSPYYKLKVGNFKERKDAEAYQKKLSVFFPKGVFIMPDKVEIKPGKGSESELDITP